MCYATDLVPFKSILHLSDFSSFSNNALQWAVAVARAHKAKLSVVHVVSPDTFTFMAPDSPALALDIQEQWARRQMDQLETRLGDVNHETFVLRDDSVWPSVAAKLTELGSDLLVVGTHGRTGLGKLFLGSVAETVLRQSPIPVMSIGTDAPWQVDGKFHRVLLATNLQPGSTESAGYAVALARRDRAQLFLLHTCRRGTRSKPSESSELSVAEALHRLHDLAVTCGDENTEKRPETIVEFGDSKTKILEVAKRTNADLVVVGLGETKSVWATTHLELGTAHTVLAHAGCPVLAVPEHTRQSSGKPELQLN